ncbi:MAG: hypothetical protein A6F71_09415 [Cycloclasticus sp. symbiont of Poecilosclerida sp. M]|nr:MAG: hypothetical protein A6F71_09415 [Cycloclasticus sp. symbiont of Poecilosclerida sp. M]
MPLDHKQPKRIAPKGMRKVHGLSSGNKSQITIVACANAAGNVLPPMVIFKGEWFNQQHPLALSETLSKSRRILSLAYDTNLFVPCVIETPMTNTTTVTPIVTDTPTLTGQSTATGTSTVTNTPTLTNTTPTVNVTDTPTFTGQFTTTGTSTSPTLTNTTPTVTVTGTPTTTRTSTSKQKVLSTLSEFLTFPSSTPKSSKKGKKPGPARVLTSQQSLELLIEKEKKKKEEEETKEKRKKEREEKRIQREEEKERKAKERELKQVERRKRLSLNAEKGGEEEEYKFQKDLCDPKQGPRS